jgi:hypothetical protein
MLSVIKLSVIMMNVVVLGVVMLNVVMLSVVATLSLYSTKFAALEVVTSPLFLRKKTFFGKLKVETV